MTNDARKNRGNGNGGKAYRNSPFWDNIEKNKERKDEKDNAATNKR